MPSLFKHRPSLSSDTSPNHPGSAAAFENRKPILDGSGNTNTSQINYTKALADSAAPRSDISTGGRDEHDDEHAMSDRRGSVGEKTSKIDSLKAKLATTKSKGISLLQHGGSSLHLPTGESGTEQQNGHGRRGSMGTAAAAGIRARSGSLGAAANENAVRRGSVPSGGPIPSSVYSTSPPAGDSLLDHSPTAVDGPSFATSWKPLQPEKKPLSVTPPASSTPTATSPPLSSTSTPSAFPQYSTSGLPPPPPSASLPLASPFQSPKVAAEAPSPASTLASTFTSNQPLPSPRSRPSPGKIAMPPPPSLMSRKSTMGPGLSIVPSTPMPRPIANLPTLNGSGNGGKPLDTPSRRSSTSFDDYGFNAPSASANATGLTLGSDPAGASTSASMSREPSAGSTGSRSGSASGSVNGGGERPLMSTSPSSVMGGFRPGLATLTSPTTAGSPRGESKRARSIMPVMLREPSQRVIQPEDGGGDAGDDDDDDDDDESSSSESDGADDGSSDTETEEVAGRYGTSGGKEGILGGVGARGLLASRRRSSRSATIGSISEDAEDQSSHVGPSVPPPLADRRHMAPPRLANLPTIPASPRNPTASLWGLPTPKTPGAGMNWAGFTSSPTASTGTGWTQFGSSTPGASTPMASPISKANGKPALGAFAMPAGVAVAAAMAAKAQTPAAVEAQPSPPQAPAPGYFDTLQAPSAADEEEQVSTPTPQTVRPSPPRELSPETPMAAEEPAAEASPEVAAEPVLNQEGPAATPAAVVVEQDDGVEELMDEEPEPVEAAAPNPNAALKGALPPFPSSASTPAEAIATPAAQAEPEPITPAEETQVAIAADDEAAASTDDDGASPMESPEVEEILPAVAEDHVEPHRPALYNRASRASRSMVNLTAEAETRDNRIDPDFAAAVRERMTASPRTSATGSTRSSMESPRSSMEAPSTNRPSMDWAKPPPTPGVGMIQPFSWSQASSPRTVGKKAEPTSPANLLNNDMPLKRRRSMDDGKDKVPDYAPPAWETLAIKPREEEGVEHLPEYWCHVHIEGYLPRKMEFSAPGVQAKDRSWKRLYFVLHGTCLSLYKHDVHKIPVRENVPEVDEADVENLHVHLPGERRSSTASSTGGLPAQRRASGDSTMSGPPGARRSSNASMTSPPTVGADGKDPALFTYNPDRSVPAPRRASTSSTATTAPQHASAREIAAQLHIGGGNQLVKRYSLQNAESGLAADYVKRRNVVRVRAEGEQFLLHTESAKEVVDWIEAFQAATNVSLDLDVRPMPKIITLPRRRRRRRPGDAAGAVPATDDTPEGNARAVAEAERAGREARLSAMDRALAEDQANE